MKCVDQQSNHRWGISSEQCLVRCAGLDRATGGIKATREEREASRWPGDLLARTTQPVCGDRVALEAALLLQLLHYFDILHHCFVVALAWLGKGNKLDEHFLVCTEAEKTFSDFLWGRSFNPFFKSTINDTEWGACVELYNRVTRWEAAWSQYNVSGFQERKQIKFFPSTRFHSLRCTALHCSLVVHSLQVNANRTSQSQLYDKVRMNCIRRRTENAPFCFSQAYHLAFPVKSSIPGQAWHKEKQCRWKTHSKSFKSFKSNSGIKKVESINGGLLEIEWRIE